MGEVARILIRGTERANLPFSTTETTRTKSRREHDDLGKGTALRYPINLVAVTAAEFDAWSTDVGPELTADRYTVGVWAWELADFPARFDPAFDLVDEIWAISSFTQKAIEARSPRPVYTLPFHVPQFDPDQVAKLDTAAIDLPEDRRYLLFMFDYFSDIERKNPMGLIRAFSEAFDEDQGPLLVIKTINGNQRRADQEKLRYFASQRRDIRLVEDYLSADQRLALMNQALGYASLHRAEGYGLTLAESMALGRPVIATGYSGNLDFMDEHNSSLVPYSLVGTDDNPTYPEPSHWAEPDLHAAAEAMRHIWEDPTWASELGSKGRQSVRQRASVEATANFIDQRVQEIMKQRKRGRFPRRKLSGPEAKPTTTRSLVRRALRRKP